MKKLSTELSRSLFSIYFLVGRRAWQSVSLGRSTCRSACPRCSTSRGRCGARWTSWSAPRPSWAPPPPASVAFYSFLCLSLHCTVPSKISDFMEHKAQFIVAHPCNPPYHTPMVELVPAPWTSTEVFALFSFCIVLPLYYVPNYIIALYLPLSTVSTQPCLTYLQVRAGARALMAEVGQGPVSLSREVPGFVLNRMQVERAFDKD